jgi:hypothetical protein
MVREFSDAAGEQWTASESGLYFGAPGMAENDGFVEGILAGVEFRSHRGQRVTGYMTRGTIAGATEEDLRNGLADALQQYGEVQ